MRIGILTHELNTNYGGILQNFALQQILIKQGHNPITLNYRKFTPLKTKILSMGKRSLKCIVGKKVPLRGWPTDNELSIITQFTQRFINRYIITTPVFNLRNLGKIKIGQLDALVVGSDQVWRGNNEYISKFFFSDFEYLNIPKVAYAASMGVDRWSLTDEETRTCSRLAKLFKAISVREDNAIQQCKEKLGVDALFVLDPTLLIDKSVYVDITGNSKTSSVNCRRMMTYVLDKSKYKQDIIEAVSEKLMLTPHKVMAEKYFIEAGSKNINKCIMPPVEDWLQGFMDADFVVTDSFHGTVFSIIFEKPFLTIINENRGACRFTSLLRLFHLESRIVNNVDEALRVINEPIDFANVKNIIDKKREESITFLINSLI